MQDDLAGLLVVSLEQAVAAPYASSWLADAGARVIKLERREGDFARRYDNFVRGQSAYFVWLNRGKESASVDLKDEADRRFLQRLLERADVFIQNLAPGASERLGFGSESLRARYPRLITCDISGYGATGPYSDLKAYDLLVQAESGLALLTGTESEPGRVGVSVCDIACGMYAYQAILRALFARERTGIGRAVSVSLFDSLADWMNVPYLQHRYGGHQPARSGLRHPSIAPYGAFQCADQQMMLIAIQNEREWQVLCALILRRPELLDDPRFRSNMERVRHRPELDSIVAAAFACRSRDEMARILQSCGIAFGRLSTLDDLARHPQLKLAQITTPAGPIELIAPPDTPFGQKPMLGKVPEVGEHDCLLRQEFAI
jgi:crotonobetainyl-CoA:carnitine CoA-transferase CaiB-like acyl-CoA transferase